MNEDGLRTSFWLMVAIQTLGSVDLPGLGERKMPAPRQYVAIVVAWLVLNLMAGISAGAQRAATAFGWLLVLTGMVAGPFGQQVTSLFQAVASNYGAGGTLTDALSGGSLTSAPAVSGTPQAGIATGAPSLVGTAGNINVNIGG